MKFSSPNITQVEIDAVTVALQEGHLSDGVVVKKFEKAFEDAFGYKNAVAMNSGTSALHLALLALGVGPGDEVITTPYTFVATVNVILAVGATPVFADIDRKTYNLCPASVKDRVTEKTKAVIPVDVYGVPADIDAIREVIPPHVKIVQDCIEAIGTKYKGQPVGSKADYAAFGFFPNKQMTTGEGGILVCPDEESAKVIRRYVAHGTTEGDEEYQQYGFNFRMTDMQAALGVAQLGRWWKIKSDIIDSFHLMDQYFGIWRRQAVSADDKVTPFVYVIELPEDIINAMGKDGFIKAMGELGVPVKPYFRDLTLCKHLMKFDDGTYALRNTARVSRRTVALPMYPGMADAVAAEVWKRFSQVYRGVLMEAAA